MELQSIPITIAWICCINLAAWGLGRLLLQLLTRGEADLLDWGLAQVFSAALGFAALATMALGLGLAGLLYRELLVGCTLVCAGAGMVQLIPPWRRRPPLPSPRHIPFLLVLLFVLTYLPGALDPVLIHDDLVYHLGLPWQYLAHGRIVPMKWFDYANMPHLVDLFNVIPMAIGDFAAPKLIPISICGWTCMALYCFARPFLGRIGASLIPLLAVAGQNIQFHFTVSSQEPFIGLWLLCACLALMAWRKTAIRGLLDFLAIMLGCTMAIKYTAWLSALPVMTVSGAMILWIHARTPVTRGGGAVEPGGATPRVRLAGLLTRNGISSVARVAVIVLALIAPWLIKNAIITGNPIYPNLFEHFDSESWSRIQEMQFRSTIAYTGGLEKPLLSYVVLPWRLSIESDSQELFESPPFFLALIFLFLAALIRQAIWEPRARDRLLRTISISALAGIILWALFFQLGRYLAGCIPLMAAVASRTLVFVRFRTWAAMAVFCLLAALAGYQGLYQWPLIEITKRIQQHGRPAMAAANGAVPLCKLLNTVVPPGGKVLGLWENRFMFLEREFAADALYQAPLGLARLRAAGNPAAFARTLAADGITHVVLNHEMRKLYMSGVMPEIITDPKIYPESQLRQEEEMMADFVEQYLEPLARFNDVEVFKLSGGAELE